MFFEFWKWICSSEIKGFSLKKCSIKGLICFPFPRVWNFDAFWKTISSSTKLLLMWILTQYFWCDNLENEQSRKEGQSRLNILKIYSKINWSYWKSILNQSKYLGFPKIFFISQSSLFFICNSNWVIVLKYFQNISAGSAFFFTMYWIEHFICFI